VDARHRSAFHSVHRRRFPAVRRARPQAAAPAWADRAGLNSYSYLYSSRAAQESSQALASMMNGKPNLTPGEAQAAKLIDWRYLHAA